MSAQEHDNAALSTSESIQATRKPKEERLSIHKRVEQVMQSSTGTHMRGCARALNVAGNARDRVP